MANLAKALEKFIEVIGVAINKAQKAIDRVLWGNVNAAPAVPPPGAAPTEPKKTKVGSFIQSGLFNALDALNRVDLCNILEYLASQIKGGKKKRNNPPKSKAEAALYKLQDAAALVRDAIDQFYAFPNDIISGLKNPNPQAAPAPGTTQQQMHPHLN